MEPWHTIEYGYDERTDLYRKTHASQVIPSAVVFARDAVAANLQEALPCSCVRVTSSRELVRESTKSRVIAFVEADQLSNINAANVPIVAVFDSGRDILPTLIQAMSNVPWLSHCIAEPLFDKPLAKKQLARLVERIVMGTEPGLLGEARTALLARASHRSARFERISMFFVERGVSPRAIGRIEEVYEELVTNALYDAPLEAGFFDRSVQRTEDVEMPKSHACEISYGFDAGMAYLRVRDTFGALTRARIVSVLGRCNGIGVELDTSRGGAGLGLWRVFSAATTVQVVIDPGKLTEVLVGISTKDKGPRGPWAMDLFVTPSASSRRWLASHEKEHDLLDQSITLVRVA
jgi:hypothetical protein